MRELENEFKASGGTFTKYKIGELFNIVKGKRLTKANMKPGNVNFLGAISTNNGVREKIATENPYPANCITVNYNGSVGCSFYQEDPFWASDDVNVCYAKGWKMTREKALYFCSVIRKYSRKYSYTQKWTVERMSESSISLPTTSNGEIAFNYMESVIRELSAYLKVSGLESTKLTDEESAAVQKLRNGNVKWKEFLLPCLFTCRSGNVDIQRKHLNGNGTIYINSGVTNHGVIGKTDYPAAIFPQNTITIDMFGNAYYRDFDYKMATHAHVFSLSNIQENLNAKNGNFICAALSYFQKKFSFSNMCNWTKMSKMKINLPVTPSGVIDWDFMETLITAEARLAIRDVIAWRNKVIEKTKGVVANE